MTMSAEQGARRMMLTVMTMMKNTLMTLTTMTVTTMNAEQLQQ
jgi:hypothetical protein